MPDASTRIGGCLRESAGRSREASREYVSGRRCPGRVAGSRLKVMERAGRWAPGPRGYLAGWSESSKLDR
jgi:hypothetical protein